jgi:hypothetical protein
MGRTLTPAGSFAVSLRRGRHQAYTEPVQQLQGNQSNAGVMKLPSYLLIGARIIADPKPFSAEAAPSSSRPEEPARQKRVHVLPAIRNHVDNHLAFHHAVNDPIGFEIELAKVRHAERS